MPAIDVTDYLRPPPTHPRTVKTRNFFRKFFELQILMLQHNAGLTDSHPYASGPINWPFLISGISFWTGPNDSREQVYMIGNVASWWPCIMAVSILTGIMGADQLARRRDPKPHTRPCVQALQFPSALVLKRRAYSRSSQSAFTIQLASLRWRGCTITCRFGP